MQSLKGFNTVVTAAPRITGATGGGGGGRGGHEGGSCSSLVCDHASLYLCYVQRLIAG